MGADQQLRVIIANDFGYIDGGSTAVAFDQAESLRKRGHQVEFFVGQAGPEESQGTRLTEVRGFRTMSLGCPSIWEQPSRAKAAASGVYNPHLTRALSELVSMGSTKNLVVLIHSWTKTLSPAIFRAVRQLELRSVLVLHDFFVGCPTGVYYDYGENRYCERRPMSAACLMARCDRDSRVHKWWRLLRHGVARTVCGMPGNVDRLVCVSQYLETIVRPWVTDPGRLTVLPNRVRGFPPEVNAHRDGQAASGFAYLGRLSEEKGARRLALAARGVDAPVTFIGDGPLREDIEQLLPTARFTGWLPPVEAVRELRQCAALVYPSLWRESFGLAVYEAASIGVPSIIPAGTAMEDFVRHGANGLVFQSEADLSELLRDAAQRPQWLVQLGVQAEKDFRAYSEQISDYDTRLERILNGVVNGL